MIRNVRFRNWRSFEDLNLSLKPGTTFVVAPNGVGKTSLVYGLTWGVFGDQSNIDPANCIRAGTSQAEVHVEIDLVEGGRLSIHRTVKSVGKNTAHFSVDGRELPASSAVSELERALGVELQVASRLSTMLGGGHVAAGEALRLEGHLHHAYGVADLLKSVDFAEDLAREATKNRATVRSNTRQSSQNRSMLEDEIASLQLEVVGLKERSIALEDARRLAAAERSRVERYFARSAERERYLIRRTHLVDETEALLDWEVYGSSDDMIEADLRNELEKSQNTIDEITDDALKTRVEVTAAKQSLHLLDHNDEKCPTCLRLLQNTERATAIALHRSAQENAEEKASELENALKLEQNRFNSINRMLAQFEALQPILVDSDVPPSQTRETAETVYQEAVDELDSHNRLVGDVTARLQLLRSQLVTEDQIKQEEDHLKLAYRQEAAARAGARALRETANQVIHARIEPLANEIKDRWHHLFTSNGLTFLPDGSITRRRGDQELAWDTLSGGERTWARIVTHLIVMSATTSVPFAWFDEPLEHLDPQLRHAVAATLARATRGGVPRQLLVTTYEHGIAQQLAEDIEGAGVLSIRETAGQN